MKILVGDKGNVDFDSPVRMTEKQREDFIDFMKSLFSVVKVEYCDEFRSERLGDKLFFREWDPDELKLLLHVKDNERLCQELGRSWMSVDIKRGDFIQPFMRWVNEKKYDLVKEDVKKLIEEFLKEKEFERILRKEERQKIDQEKKKLKKKLEVNREKLKRQKWRRSLKRGDSEKIEEAIAETELEIKKIEERLNELE